MVKMKLSELYANLKSLGYPTAYHHFEEPVTAPYIVWLTQGINTFYADDSMYNVADEVDVELYTDTKDLKVEKELEDLLQKLGLNYKKYSGYSSEEHLYITTYEMEIMTNG